MIRILVGDCRVSLLKIKEKSVQVCVTSPPYFGLRSYNVDPLVWGGRGDCEHLWIIASQKVQAGGTGEKSAKQVTNTGSQTSPVETAFCQLCTAWRGSLGLEPTLEMYVTHLVEIFRETRRVLRDDGVLVLNLGDSYWGGKGQSGSGGKEFQQMRCSEGVSFSNPAAHVGGPGKTRPTDGKHDVLKPKDLMGIPWRVALALQADGWYLRSAMPWLKASAMPESVRDRPTTAHEYVFLLSKSKKYYWDAEAIRVPNKEYKYQASRNDGQTKGAPSGPLGPQTLSSKRGRAEKAAMYNPSGRNYRTTDAYIAPLDHAIAQARDELTRLETLRDTDGLLLDEEGNPVALKVNPGNFKGSHFATFPIGLCEPFIKAGSSEKGECPECGTAWVRVVERRQTPNNEVIKTAKSTSGVPGLKAGTSHERVRRLDGKNYVHVRGKTLGWRPSCACSPDDLESYGGPNDVGEMSTNDPYKPVPQIILDPFGGAMTAMLVADRLQRNGIACELNPDYAEMGRERLVSDGGMFMDVRVE